MFCLIRAIAVTPLIIDGQINAFNGEIFLSQDVPHITFHTGGSGQQRILELETIVIDIELQFCQFRFGHKAKGQIIAVFQQDRIAKMIDLFKNRAFLVLSLPFNGVFQVQEQVGYRRGLLMAIPVIGVLRAIAKGLHKLRNFYIRRTGKCGNAVVTIEGAVIQCLGVGRFCPVKEAFACFPFLHIADNRSRIGGTSGIIGYAGTIKMHAKADEITNNLDSHHRKQQHGGKLTATGNRSFMLLYHLLIRIFRKLSDTAAVNKHACIKRKKTKAVQQEHPVFQFLGAGKDTQAQRRPNQNLPDLETAAQQPRTVGHIQQHKAEQEAEPVRDHVCKMKTVPDIVQLPQNKAEHEKHKQQYTADFIAQLDISAGQIEKCQQHTANTAIKVRQAFLKGRLDAAAHIACHLAHSAQQTLPGIGVRNVHTEPLRELIDAGLGSLQRRKSGQLQNCRHANG